MSNLFTRPQHKAGSLLRGLSAPLWTPSDLEYVRLGGLDRGYGFIDDFQTLDPAWVFTDNTPVGSAATWALDDAKGGVAILSSVSTTANEGGNVVHNGVAAGTTGEKFIASADSEIFFEARVKLDGTFANSQVDVFVGLTEQKTKIIGTSANDSANYIGFEHYDNDLALDFGNEKAGTNTATAGLGTIADGTWLKLGFHVKGVDKITPYVDGVKKTAITTNIPIVEMTPGFCLHTGDGTDTPQLHIDWVACYQFEQISH